MAFNPRENNWSTLDNTGKLFPAVSGEPTSNVFRFSAQLYEPVEPDALRRALDRALRAVPAFAVKLRRGLFWYYFEQHLQPPVVHEEDEFPCAVVDPRQNGGYLFNVSYFGRRINLEVFHVLADGSGALYFLNFLLYYYVNEVHPDEARHPFPKGLRAPVRELQEDAFARYYTTRYPAESSTFDREAAQPITGQLLPLGSQGVIEAKLSAKQLLALARACHATVTEYLTAALFLAIHRAYGDDPKGRPVKISVPVNLRNFFPSSTVRNFFLFVRMPVYFSRRSYAFQELVEEVQRQMREQVNRPKLAARIRYQVELEQKQLMRLVPRPVKNLGMKVAYKLAEKGYTCTLTNLGRMQLPPEVLPHVEQVGVMLGASRSNVLKLAMVSCGDQMVLTFNTTIEERAVQREFLTFLTSQGVQVTLRCNTAGEVPSDEPL